MSGLDIMRIIKPIAKHMPGVSDFYNMLVEASENYRLKNMSPEDIFTDIYQNKTWAVGRSLSGGGSELDQTKAISIALPKLFNDYQVTTILDIPCGDFHWMKTVDLQAVEYLGADIVEDLIHQNRRYETENIHFYQMDLLKDSLPEVDLILCRDCLIHFSFKDIFRALNNIIHSNSRYTLMTTYVERKENEDILTGRFRVINLQMPPFNLPPPLRVISEESTEKKGKFWDKSLGLWKVEDIISCCRIK